MNMSKRTLQGSELSVQIDLQAQSRVHRIGQTRPVLVIRLQTVASIEGRILAAAEAKRRLADASVDGANPVRVKQRVT